MTSREAVAKMASCAVLAELKFRDGLTEKIRVNVDNSLSSLISGVRELNADVSRLLSELVEREKSCGDCAEGEEEEEEDSDEEDAEPLNSQVQPPAKRSKT